MREDERKVVLVCDDIVQVRTKLDPITYKNARVSRDRLRIS